MLRTHGMDGTPELSALEDAIQRCQDKKRPKNIRCPHCQCQGRVRDPRKVGPSRASLIPGSRASSSMHSFARAQSRRSRVRTRVPVELMTAATRIRVKS
jgi:hypothetical protein